MKAKKAIAILLALVLALSLCPAISLADDTVENDSLNLESAVSAGEYAWEAIDADADGEADYYVMSGITYCANPVERFADYETLDIYVPAAYLNADGSVNAEGTSNGYTYSSAPIVLPTNMGMYAANLASSKSYTSFSDMLDCGYVVINIGHRGIIRGGDEYAGDAATSPNAVVDTKAGIRYIKYNADFIPGDESKLVTTGNSGSGALSMFIACTGNAVEYAPYLVEIGAIGVTDNGDGTYNMTDGASDNVYASNAYCPIADVANADMAYEWLFGTDEQLTELGVTAMQEALSGYLAEAFYDYVYDTIGMSDTEFDAVMTAAVERAMNTFFENMRDGNANVGQTDGQYEVTWTDDAEFADAENPTLEEVATNFIAGNWEWDSGRRDYIYGSETNVADWLTWNSDTQRAEVTSLYEFGNYFSRQKDVGAFDALDRNATENTPFGNATIGSQHYSESLYNVLVEYKDALSALWTDADAENTGCESYDALLDAYYNDIYVAGDDGISVSSDRYGSNIADLYSHLLFIDDNTAEYEGETPEHVRIRMGCYDANTAAAVIVLMGEAFDKAGVDVDYGLVWNGQHGDCDYGDDSLYDWIDELCAPSMDLNDYNGKWAYNSDYNAYELLNVIYCATPENAAYEALHIYIPAVYVESFNDGYIEFNDSAVSTAGYTASTAPIIYCNPATGWSGKVPQTLAQLKNGRNLELDYVACLEQGFVCISAGERGRGTTNYETGEYDGMAPNNVVDIKAGIRFVKANADAIPGDVEKIISAGTSGGGGMSAIIGASGNSADYDEYLEEIGAIMTETDDVYADMCYCPITDLDNADMAYAWFYLTKYLGEESTLSDFQKALAADLAAEYEDYIVSLNLDSSYEENFDNYSMDVASAFESSLEKYLSVNYESAEDAAAYVAEKYTWITYDAETGSVTIAGETGAEKLANIVANHNKGSKSVPGFDVFDESTDARAESHLFGTATESSGHFSLSLATTLINNNEKYSALDGYVDYTSDYAVALTDATQQRAKMLNPMYYIQEYITGETNVSPAQHFRLLVGSTDGNTTPTVVFNLGKLIETAGIDVEYAYIWGQGHGTKDYDGEFIAWVNEICAPDSGDEPAVPDEPTVGNTSVADATVTTLTPHVDGKEIKVTMYEDCYVSNPNREEDQQISIYIPETATADSPIMFYVNNSGWQSNTYSGRTQVQSYQENVEQTNSWTGVTSYVTLGDYSSDSDSDKIGVALKEGYVIVSYGARSRSNGETDGEYLGHSPATMTDTKAAIRYLRYNAEALDLNTDEIIITGTSGGGALSTVIAASGNSSDFYESLYEIGAAGISKNADGSYVNDADCGDNVLAVIAYCPITDFRGADMAYEWLYYETRVRLVKEADGTQLYNGITNDELLEYSAELKEAYETYFNGLGLVDENGVKLTTDNLLAHIEALMKAEFDTTLEQYTESEGSVDAAVKAMIADIESKTAYTKLGTNNWLIFETDESGAYTGEYTYNIAEHLYFLANNQTLKVVNAFSNQGLEWASQNEDNLFGSATDVYSPFEYLSWELDSIVGNGVGEDDAGTWTEYMKTEEGQYLSMQLRMTSAVDYLNDPGDATPATYWYVRHGVLDRDTSFAVESTLFYSLYSSDAVEDDNINVGFAWLRQHEGDYDVQEAYTWLAEVLEDASDDSGNSGNGGGSGHASGSVNTGAGSSTGTTTTTGTFSDVSTGAYYYDAVEWAVANGITTGTSDTTFSPEIGCSRAQIVTFLWRAAGSPETEGENPFTDVEADAYYYDAILWAVANGITNGTTDTTFSPDDTCTRAQIVTFLYRYAGASAEATETFSDVDANAYYAAPVAWAVANGITNGTSDTTFSPDDACTRAQVVTFLYRYSAA